MKEVQRSQSAEIGHTELVNEGRRQLEEKITHILKIQQTLLNYLRHCFLNED